MKATGLGKDLCSSAVNACEQDKSAFCKSRGKNEIIDPKLLFNIVSKLSGNTVGCLGFFNISINNCLFRCYLSHTVLLH